MREADDPKNWARMAQDRPMWVRVAVGIAIALFLGMTFALRDSVSNGDLGFKIAMAVAGVVGIAMVAPGIFTGRNRDPTDWSEEIKSMHEDSKAESTGGPGQDIEGHQ
jgi:high-affinity Fe2+/Pb2+ permease